MGIPKYPDVPKLTEKQVQEITEIVFYKEIEPTPCDVIFVFGGTSLANMKHSDWKYAYFSEY